MSNKSNGVWFFQLNVLHKYNYVLFESSGTIADDEKCYANFMAFQRQCEQADLDFDLIHALPGEGFNGFRRFIVLVLDSDIKPEGARVFQKLEPPDEFVENLEFRTIRHFDSSPSIEAKYKLTGLSVAIRDNRHLSSARVEAWHLLYSMIMAGAIPAGMIAKPEPDKRHHCPRCDYPRPDKRVKKRVREPMRDLPHTFTRG